MCMRESFIECVCEVAVTDSRATSSTPDYVFDKVGKILLEYHWPQGRLEAIVERFTELGFNYKFEDGRGYEDGNGTVFFYRG